MILNWISAMINWLKESTAVWIAKMKQTAVRIVLTISILALMLWVSVFFYGSFYYVYMPQISHIKPVHLQFRCSDDKLSSFPEANLSLLNQYREQLLNYGQPYIVVLQLDMPESPANQNHGMFMVNLEIFDKKDEVVRTSQRSVLLRYKSSLLQIMETLVYAPMFLSGAREQKQTLMVEFFSRYEEDAYKPASKARITVESKNIQIYSSTLKIYAYFTGLRYLMFNWPILSAIGGVGSNMLFLLSIVLLSWWRYNGYEDETSVTVHVQSKHGKSLDERRRSLQAVLNKERTEVRSVPSTQSLSKLDPSQSAIEEVGINGQDDDIEFIVGAEDDGNNIVEVGHGEMELRHRGDRTDTTSCEEAS